MPQILVGSARTRQVIPTRVVTIVPGSGFITASHICLVWKGPQTCEECTISLNPLKQNETCSGTRAFVGAGFRLTSHLKENYK